MAIAYVSAVGTAAYPGSVSAPTNLPNALSSAAAGDTVYIATGVYRGAYTLLVSGTSGSQINFIGDSTNAQNIVGSSGYIVRITNYTSDTASPTDAPALTASGRSYVNFNSLYFDAFSTTGVIALSAGTNITFTKCVFATTTTGHGVQHTLTSATGPALSLTQCVYVGNGTGYLWRQLGNFSVTNMACYVTDCLAIGGLWFVNGAGSSAYGTKYDNVYFYNNTVFQGSTNSAVQMQIVTPGTSTMYFYNNYIVSTIALSNVVSTTLAENYNTFIGTRSNIAALSEQTRTTTSFGFAFDYGLLTGTFSIPFFAPYLGSVNQGAGTAISAPITDIYNRIWSTARPDIGSTTSYANTLITAYLPTERNQSSVQITAGSTSRSLYLYLGATGLTATTTGLQAYYTKEDAAPVSIPLVSQTTTGAWVSGGFAEVSATNQPGVYRLDIPNAAISAGYYQTVVTVRGASGTNGAVVVIQEPPVLGSQVRMGPFTVQADGVLTDERLKLFKGSIHSIDFKMVDQYGTGVDGTGTVVTANAYNSAGFLVDSYPCTAKYAEDGRYSFAIDATVTNVVGMYTINISRQIGSEINVFGRMKLEVLSP